MTPGADLPLLTRRVWARMRLLGHVLSDLGLPVMGLVIWNSTPHRVRQRQGAARAGAGLGHRSSGAAQRLDLASEVQPGTLEGLTPEGAGARFNFERAELEVLFLTDDLVRFSWGPGREPIAYAVDADADWKAPRLATIDRFDDGWSILSDSVQVNVSRVGEVTISRRDGTVLRALEPPVRVGPSWEERWAMAEDELLSGLGEQAAGIDLRGGRFRIWNRDAGGAWGPGSGPLYLGAPVVVGAHGGGSLLSFYENPTRARFDLGAARADQASVRFESGELRSYVAAGEMPQLLERYSRLTGRPALPPRWALGYHQSRWGYKNQKVASEVVAGYARLSLPLSALHLDIDYMDGYRVFTVDERRFPDLSRLSDELAERGARLMTIVDPGLKVDPDYPLYAEGSARGFFCRDEDGRISEGVAWPGRIAFPDFTSAEVRSWWSEQYPALLNLGVGGVWHDMNEPASIALRGDPTLPLGTRHLMEGRGADHSEAHNLFGLLMNRAGFEGLRKARPDRRPFIVSRSGWASNQRWAWTWTADANSTWDAMRQQVATLVGLGLSGIPFSGSDIGGFSGVPDDELYLRWLQMSVFTAFCRTHSVVGVPAREPWRFREPTRSLVTAWIRFRYRLLPYLYTLAHEAAANGSPLVRPPWWPKADSQQRVRRSDRSNALAKVDDEFLLGDCLLVAPVCEPAARQREVVLPSGSWRGLWAGSPNAIQGDSGLAGADAPLEWPPVFVREGVVVPLDDGFADPRGPLSLGGDERLPGGASSGPGGPSWDHSPRLLAFHCWPTWAGEARGSCADDEGDGYGPMRRDRLELSGAGAGSDALLLWSREGEFPAPARVRVVLHGFESSMVVKDGHEIGPTRDGAIECDPFDRLELTSLFSA